MISIIITSYKEPKTIGRAIEAILKNKLPKEYEILVTAPDKETLNAAKKYSFQNKNILLVQDKGEGKPAALNLVLKKAKGDILVFTDGDVSINESAIENLLSCLEDKEVGAVSGNPVSIDSKNSLLGFWAYVLTNVANEQRKEFVKEGKQIFCSGYLFAIRKNLFPELPKDLLSEDGFISNNVYLHKKIISYSQEAKVFIKYPNSFKDWILQKKRSAGGYNQIKKITGKQIRSFKTESFGAFRLFKYCSSWKEYFYLILLFFARIYLWALIYRDINIKKKSQKEIWKRVESTK